MTSRDDSSHPQYNGDYESAPQNSPTPPDNNTITTFHYGTEESTSGCVFHVDDDFDKETFNDLPLTPSLFSDKDKPFPSLSPKSECSIELSELTPSLTTNDDNSTERDELVPGGWRRTGGHNSLPDSYATVQVPTGDGQFWRKLWSFMGLGLMVAVGYMDPGNWQTDLSGGSKFGYNLLFIILLSNFMAMILQHLSLKLGVVANRDLAQACRDAYHPHVVKVLWVLAEIAIAATDLAEVIGSAIALKMLFNLKLVWGCLITAADVLVVLILEQRYFRYLEFLVGIISLLIMSCFTYQMAVSGADWQQVGWGLLPRASIVTNSEQLFIAIGIIGATVMPHNLYLHSSTIQTRAFEHTVVGRKEAIKFGTIDSTVSLLLAFFINASILILAAAAFHEGETAVEDLSEAYTLLSPALGAKAAGTLFAIALLASGQNSTITGTLSGQIVMEGFIDLKLQPATRRLLTRCIAIVPATIVAAAAGDHGVTDLLVISQVILSLQLGFAVFPLVQFTSSKAKMGEEFVNSRLLTVVAYIIFIIITGLNIYMIISTIQDAATGSSD